MADVLAAPEAERALLGAVLVEPALAVKLLDQVQPGDFWDTRHETLWDVYAACVDDGADPDLVTVTDRLRRHQRTDLMAYLPTLVGDQTALSQVDHYAATIVDYARRRRLSQLGIRLQQAAHNGTDPAVAYGNASDAIDAAARDFMGGHETSGIRYLELDGIFTRPRKGADWLVRPLVAAGRATLLYSPGKAGKSILAQEAAAALATGRACLSSPPGRQRHVLYVDQEMTWEDWADRLADMGYAVVDESALAEYLHVAQMQVWPPLDTAAGGDALHREALRVGAELVIIDTVSKVTSGEENSNDTQQAFYRHTLIPLKRDGIAALDLDHTGKDPDRGARGGSAKTDNIDLAFELYERGKDLLALRCSHHRFRDDAFDHPTFLRRTTEPVAHEIETYRPSDDHGPGFRPTHLMQKVSRYIALNPGLSQRAILAAKLGKVDPVKLALELLTVEGYVAKERKGRSDLHRVVQPFYEDPDEDPASDAAGDAQSDADVLPMPSPQPDPEEPS